MLISKRLNCFDSSSLEMKLMTKPTPTILQNYNITILQYYNITILQLQLQLQYYNYNITILQN